MNSTPPAPTSPPLPDAIAIDQAHQLYCQLTGQSLSLRYDRQRMWFELLRAGFSLHDLRSVISYLQREIRTQRRNVGALKLSNLLQPDRFEEDLQISRLRLRPLSSHQPSPPSTPPADPTVNEHARQRALVYLRHLKSSLR